MTVTIDDAKRIAKLLKTTVPPERLLVGMQVELEHGTKSGEERLNVTEDDLIKTAKIALAHFAENPGSADFGDYYDFLEDMEKSSDRYWKEHMKPTIFQKMTAYDLMML